MPETPSFTCPCCGQRAPQDRLEEGVGPFPLEEWIHSFGGKTKFTEEEREERKGTGFRPGSGRGRMAWEQIVVSPGLKEAFARRIEELKGGE